MINSPDRAYIFTQIDHYSLSRLPFVWEVDNAEYTGAIGRGWLPIWRQSNRLLPAQYTAHPVRLVRSMQFVGANRLYQLERYRLGPGFQHRWRPREDVPPATDIELAAIDYNAFTRGVENAEAAAAAAAARYAAHL